MKNLKVFIFYFYFLNLKLYECLCDFVGFSFVLVGEVVKVHTLRFAITDFCSYELFYKRPSEEQNLNLKNN